MTADGATLLARDLLRRRRPLTRLFAWSTVEAVPAFGAGLLLAAALDRGFLAGRPVAGLGWLALLVTAYVIGGYGSRQTYPHLADLIEPLRDDLTERVVRAHLDPHRPLPHGSGDAAAVARITEQVDSVRQQTATLLRTIRPAGTSVLAGFAGLAALAPVLVPMLAAPLCVAVAAYVLLLPMLARHQRAVLVAAEQTATVSGSVLGALRDVEACGAGRQATATVAAAVDLHARAADRLARAAAVRTLVMGVGGYAPLLVLVAATPWLLGRDVTVGQITGAALYVILTLQPAVLTLAQLIGTVGVQLAVTADRLVEPGAAPADPGPAAPRPAGAQVVRPIRSAALRVTVRDLRFGYRGAAAPVLQNLDLDIAPGERLAVVGPSGGGKSTLVNMLAGLMLPQRGAICLDDVPLGAVAADDLHRMVALMPQEAYVHAGSIRENLTYLDPAVSAERLEAAVDTLGLGPLVRRLGGYDAVLRPGGAGRDGGVVLSAGERQLIGLARVYLAPAGLILLDEATSNLDPAAEEAVEEAFDRMSATVVLVAHRISTAVRADRVLLLDGPQALVGTHRDLQVRSPVYAALVHHWAEPPPAPHRVRSRS